MSEFQEFRRNYGGAALNSGLSRSVMGNQRGAGLRHDTLVSLCLSVKPTSFIPIRQYTCPSIRWRCAPSATHLHHAVHGSSGAALPLRVTPRGEDYSAALRSEDHTSELQSPMSISYAACCLNKKTPVPNRHIIR